MASATATGDSSTSGLAGRRWAPSGQSGTMQRTPSRARRSATGSHNVPLTRNPWTNTATGASRPSGPKVRYSMGPMGRSIVGMFSPCPSTYIQTVWKFRAVCMKVGRRRTFSIADAAAVLRPTGQLIGVAGRVSELSGRHLRQEAMAEVSLEFRSAVAEDGPRQGGGGVDVTDERLDGPDLFHHELPSPRVL